MGLNAFLSLFILILSVLTLANGNFVATIKEAQDSIKPELRRLVITYSNEKSIELIKNTRVLNSTGYYVACLYCRCCQDEYTLNGTKTIRNGKPHQLLTCVKGDQKNG